MNGSASCEYREVAFFKLCCLVDSMCFSDGHIHMNIQATLMILDRFCWAPGNGTRIYSWFMSWIFGAYSLWWGMPCSTLIHGGMVGSWSCLKLMCQPLLNSMRGLTLWEEWMDNGLGGREGEQKVGRARGLRLMCKINKILK